VSATRGFYRYLVISRRLQSNPADDLQPPRAWPALPKYLSIEEVDRLLAQPDEKIPRGLRDRAFIEVLYATGLRVSELVALKVTDVNESKEMVLEALDNIEGTPREIVVLNAGAALYAADKAASIAEGIERAREAVASGAARRKLDQFVATTQKLAAG